MKREQTQQHISERLRRDLASDFSLPQMELWSDLPTFFCYIVDRSLKKDLRPNDSTDPYADEKEAVAVFLVSLVVAGAFCRKTIHTELARLTTTNVPLNGKWFQIDTYKPTQTGPKRHQQLRFPLPPLCQALLLRVALFYELHSQSPRSPLSQDSTHTIDWKKDNHPLFSARIRNQRQFILKWLKKAYRDFQKEPKPALHNALQPDHQQKAFSWKLFLSACQARLLETLPPWAVAGLRQRWKSSPSELWDIERNLLGRDMRFVSRTSGKWIEQYASASDDTQPLESNTGEAPLVFPPPLIDAYMRITEAVKSLHADMDDAARHQVQQSIREAKGLLQGAMSQAPGGLFTNAIYLADWLIWLLGRKGLSGATVKTYYQAIQTFIFYVFGNEVLDATTDRDELIDHIAECMYCYDNPNTQTSVREGFRSFFNWLAEANILPKLQWNSEELKVYRDASDRPIFTFKDIDRLLQYVDDQVVTEDLTEDLALRLKVFIILAFFAGLRRREAARLTLQDIDDAIEFLLWVRRSKSKHGIRVLRLDLLMLDEHLKLLRQQVTACLDRYGSNRSLESIPLLPDETGDFCQPSFYSEKVRDLMHAIFETGSAHLLRHSFATLFLVRSDIAVHGLSNSLPSQEFDHPMFKDPAMTRFDLLLFGQGSPERRPGYRAMARPLWILQSLIGHSCPETTLSYYSHALDLIYFLALHRQGDNPKILGAPCTLDRLQAASLLLQTPENQSKNGFIDNPTLTNVVRLQRNILDL